MVKRNGSFWLVLSVVAIAGCAGRTAVIKGTNLGVTDTVDIRLVPYDPNRVDTLFVYGTLTGYSEALVTSGDIWTHVFSSDEDLDATFTIASARMEQFYPENSEMWVYFVEGDVRCNNDERRISTQGGKSASWALQNAMRVAMEDAIWAAAEEAVSFCEKGDKAVSRYQRLRELNELMKDGILTEREFKEEKRKILDQED